MTRSRQTADWGSRAGLAKIVPSSVAVGSGTGSADTTGTVTVSAASSVSLNGVFSSTYDNYRIFINGNTASNSDVSLRLRVSGTDNSSAVYNRQFLEANNTSVVGARANSNTSIQIGGMGANVGDYDNLIILEVTRPFVSGITSFLSNLLENRSTVGVMARMFTGIHAASISADGFTLIISSNLTAKITVLGYN
jgi:hypothetical protein